MLDRNKIKMISEYSLVDLGQLRELHIEENRYVYSGTTQHYNGPSKDRDNLSSKGTFRIFTKVYSVQYWANVFYKGQSSSKGENG